MLITFFLGAAAGLGTIHAEPQVKRLLENALMAEAPISATELRLLSFALCLVAAAIVSAVLGNGSGVALSIGAVFGVFGPRAMRQFRPRDTPDRPDR